jgi:hypothetical protein
MVSLIFEWNPDTGRLRLFGDNQMKGTGDARWEKKLVKG